MHCWVRGAGEKRRVQRIDLVGKQRRQSLRWRTNVLDERARRIVESIVGGERTESEDKRGKGRGEVGRAATVGSLQLTRFQVRLDRTGQRSELLYARLLSAAW